jgi:O-antigen/teichoic acid export membrane protein
MKHHILSIVKHPIITGSSIVFLGNLIANFFNFLFNIFMSRNLSIIDFGILTTLISVIGLASIPSSALVPTIVSFAGTYVAKGEDGKIRNLFIKMQIFTFIVGTLFLSFFIIFNKNIGSFFHITNSLYITIVGLIIFISYAGVVNSGILQARLAFLFISFTNILGASIKFLLGVFLIVKGFSILGAFYAFFLSYVIPYILTYIPIYSIISNKKSNKATIDVKSIFLYGIPSGITMLCLLSFISMDVILVKHFFSPEQAGLYAGLSLIGRVIFYFSGPIGMVMFPMVVQQYAKKEKYSHLFYMSLGLVFLASFAITLVYFLFPTFIIELFLKNKNYLVVENLLGLFGIYITIYSLLSVLVNFYLSIKYTKVMIPILIGSILQISLIWICHNSFFQIIFISISITSLLLVLLLLYYWRMIWQK